MNRGNKRIVEVYCPGCGHNKAFASDSGRVKCSRCGHLHKAGLL